MDEDRATLWETVLQALGGVEPQRVLIPANIRVMVLQPWDSENDGVMPQSGDEEFRFFVVFANRHRETDSVGDTSR